MNAATDKGLALLAFLRASAATRRKRVSTYGTGDKLIWFADIPRDRAECRSPFLTDNPSDTTDWLEVRRKRMPTRPPLPEAIALWVRAENLDSADKEPELRAEITVLVKEQVSDSVDHTDSTGALNDQRPEALRLADNPEVEEAWLEYLISSWEPWAKETRRWQDVQRVYEELDFMRRRLEESEERYELLLAVGMLQWRDPTGTSVARHLLTAPAEISLDAARGVLTVIPAASFDGFRVELDMLELQHQPRLQETTVEDKLEELDIQAWDTARLGPIFREIANRLRADTAVDEGARKPADRSESTPRLSYAPALVLRERRPTGYEELLRKFIENVGGAEWETTKPWRRLLAEGETHGGASVGSESGPDATERPAGSLERYLFPLPANNEQRQIIDRLQVEPCVLVKGPPGTGKSHTIANLICHLLAVGERVLVTAHAPKALSVLRGLLPEDIRDLSVTNLGSSREDQRLLEESVRGILRRKNEWSGPLRTQAAIDHTEGRLQQVKDALAKVELDLRDCREAETHTHSLPGGYEGTAARIARRLNEEQPQFGWFPNGGCTGSSFPLQPGEVAFLSAVHRILTDMALEELRYDVGDAQLPTPDQFGELLVQLSAAEESATRARNGVEPDILDLLGSASREELEGLHSCLSAIEEHSVRASRVLGDVADTVLADLLLGSVDRWSRLAADAGTLLGSAETVQERLGASRLELPTAVPHQSLRSDAQRRRVHFEQGKGRGFSVFASRVIKETRYVEEQCLVDGGRPRDARTLAKVVHFLDLMQATRDFEVIWPSSLPVLVDPRHAAARATDLAGGLQDLLRFHETLNPVSINCVPLSDRAALASADRRKAWQRAVTAELASRHLKSARDSLQRVCDSIRRQQRSRVPHPCLDTMTQAVHSCDLASWSGAWDERERLRAGKREFQQWNDLVDQLEDACPGLGVMVRAEMGNADWSERLLGLPSAWAWSNARAWLQRASDSSVHKALVQDFHRLQGNAEKATEELVSLRAWRVFFDRLDDATVQSLNAWTRAVDRIGKGTGKHAYRHRRTARQYLMACVPKIPAWVMPLHKLWDTVDAEPGMFDTVIIDEASQAGIESLALLLLAKRVIVVGDDKQNSPEAVGVLEDDIARLAREHLGQFRFRDEYRPDTSLFDHAERSFGGLISLREHFRCVPEIIRFSNDLCYRDVPLIPLRQAPPNRLPPVLETFVAQGSCEGEGQRIRNRAEAEALVEAIRLAVADDAYEGKTMGVIALQGHAQAELIEQLLLQALDPGTVDERRLRCGEPASFQGDQRDIIFLSLVIAPNVNFRALGRLPDQRRFNVAMSRARDQVRLFHSVRQVDLGPDDLRRRLLSFFENPGLAALDVLSEDHERLEREARGPRRLGNQPEPYDSWFEVDVCLELLRRKYSVRPQVDTAGRRIDLVVEGIDARLAVECDGDVWHGAEQYEQDMARQRQLERSGWTFVHVRDSDFYTDREGAVRAITEACEDIGVNPLDHVEEPRAQPIAREAGRQPAASVRETQSNYGAPLVEDDEAAESDVSTAEFGPFTGYSVASGFPDPRDASPTNVRSILRQIIEADGPLTRSSVYRLYVEGCPSLQRVGRVVRQALNRTLGAMLRTGEILQEDELGVSSPEGQVIRLAGAARVRERPAGKRDLVEIPPSELLTVVGRLFPGGQWTEAPSESLLRSVLDHYRFVRLTRPRREYLSRVLRLPRSV